MMARVIGRSGKRPRTARLVARRIAVVMTALLALTIAVPSGVVRRGGHFPLDWLWSWAQQGPAWSSPLVGLPQQQFGTPSDDHYVSAKDTRAAGGTGRAPGRAPGALAPDDRTSPVVKRTTTRVKPGPHSFDAKTSKRIATASTARSNVYANTDGSYTRRVYNEPVNFKAPDGTWKPIDRNLRRDPDGRLRQKASSADVSFGPKAADQDLARLRLPGGEVFAYAIQGAGDVVPEVAGDTVTYRGALPDVDVKLTTLAAGVKESLVIHSPRAGNSWVFPLRLDGLTAKLEPGGSVTLRGADGKVRARIPHGYMEDTNFDPKSGGFARSDAVTYTLTTVDGRPALKVTADAAWLRDPARKYPVTLDPTTGFDTTGDTYVRSGETIDRSGSNELLVGTYNGGGSKAYSFLKFDGFNWAYNGAKVSGVWLHIFDSWAYTCTPKPFWVNPITVPWEVNTPKTYPGPAFGGAIGTVTANPGPACTNTSGDRAVGTWMSVPLSTWLFQSWALGGTNYGLAVTASQTDSTQWKRFTSRNGPAGLAPYLEVAYEPNIAPQINSQYPPYGHMATTLTPELMTTSQDPDNWPGGLTHNFMVFDKDGNKIVESGAIGERSWVVPAGKLTWGGTYKWTVVASDTNATSYSQTVNLFSTPVPQPLVTSTLAQNGGHGFDPNAPNYTTAATDATVATAGPALNVQRSYNSADTRTDSAFGSGWSSLLDMKASEVSIDSSRAADTVVVRYPNGQEVAFGLNSDGTYTPPAGRFATFTKVPSGGYKLVDKDGTTYLFTSAATVPGVWSITSIADATGRALTFTYEYPSVIGVATKVTSASGRSLYLTWSDRVGNLFPHVQSVSTDPVVPGNAGSALTWSYTYDGNQLAKVCPPTSGTACTTYTYASISQHPNTVLNAGPYSYWRLGESTGTVAASAVLGNQGTDNGTYTDVALGQPGPLPGSTGTAAGFNGTTSRVQLPAKLAGGTTYQSVSMWFKTTTPGGVLLGQSVGQLGATTTNGYQPVLYVGSDGKLTGQFATAPAVGPLGGISGGASGRCLDVTGVSNANGAPIQLYDCHGGANQQWTLTSTGAIQTTIGGVTKCLDAPGAGDGVQLTIYDCHGGPNQRWTINADGRIVGVQSGKCVDAYGYGSTNGTKIQLWNCIWPGPGNQYWYPTAHAPLISTPTVTDGQWHHAVLSSAGTTQTLYLDGQAVGTKTGLVQDLGQSYQYVGAGFLGGGWPGQSRPATSVTNSGFASYFTGTIGEVSAYDRALTGANVKAIWRSGTAAAPVLASVVRPSGNPAATIQYDTGSGALTQVNDTNGGAWRIAPGVVTGSHQVYAGAVLSAGPSDYYRLADSGTAVAVNQVNGGQARYNGVTLGVAGGPFDDPDRADDNTTVASFNGSSSFVELPTSDIPTTGPSSVSMWFRTTAAGGVLFSYQTAQPTDANPFTGNWVPGIYVGNDGKLRGHFWVNNVGLMPVSANPVNDGKWHHVALAAGTNTQALYLDGARVGNEVNAPLVATTAQHAYLGVGNTQGWPASPANTRGYYTGEIAEVAYFKSQLSATQVALQYAGRAKSAGAPVRTVKVTDPGNKTLTYVYDVPAGRKIAEVDALGNRTQYGYDEGGYLRTSTDPNGNVTTTEHDVRGNTVSSTTCQQRSANRCSTVYYTYFPDATTKTLTPNPRNDVLLTMRDGRSSSATDNTYLTTYEYDANGNRTSVTDPLGRVTRTTYTDGTSVVASDGGFALAGLPSTVTTAGGARQTVVYTKSGDVAKVTDPVGKETTFTYDGIGRVVSTTEKTDTFPGGLTTTLAYDKLSRIVTRTEPAVTNRVTGAVHTAVATTVYDDDGQVTSETISDTTGGDAPRVSTATYNARGQQVTATDAAGKTTTFEYDAYGNPVKEISTDGGQIVTAFDAENNLLSSTLLGYTGDPNNPEPARDLVVTSRAYDPAGRLASVSDAMGWVTSYAYTDNGLTAKVTRQDPTTGAAFVVETNTYDGAGNLLSKTTNNGTTTTTFAVDAAGRTTSSTLDPTGLKRTTSYVYSVDDHPESTRQLDGTGAVVARTDATYDPLGRMLSRTVHNNGAELTTRWTLDSDGLATATTDPNGNTTNYSYDEAGRVAVTTGPPVLTEVGGGTPVSSRAVSYTGYDTFGAVVESKDPNGNVTVASYDAAGRQTSTRLPAYTPPGSSTPITPVSTQAYDTLGQVTAATDPLGKVTRYAYDQLGRVSKVTAPNGGETKFSYDLLGNQLSATDPTGAKSTATYDFLGRRLTSTQVVRQTGGNHTTTYAYNSSGFLSTVTLPSGNTTVNTYNVAGEAVTVKDGANNVTTYTYDAVGRRVRTTLPDSTFLTVGYDQAGRPVNNKAFDAAGVELSATSQTYDPTGNVTAVTDARGTTSTFTYDATGMPTSVVQPINGSDSITTSFGYDPDGNRTRFTDGRGNRFLTTYNSWSLPESRVEPATAAFPNAADRTFTAVYDAAGRVTQQRAPGGVTVTNTYDDMGRLTGQTGTGAEVATAARTFGYDLAGRVTSLSAPGGTNTFTYDDRGQLLTAQGPSGNSSFAYNGDGALTQRVDAAGTTTYTYDTAGRLASLSNPTADVQASFSYDSVSQVRGIGYGSTGNSRTLSYDSQHRLTGDELKTAAGASIAKIAYGYDANGNETSKTTTGFTGSATNTYTYDLANRLTSWNNGTSTTVYAYDKSGNRVQSGARTFTYDERNQLLTGSGGTTYQYTARGTLRRTITGAGTADTLTDAFGQVITQQVTGGPTQTYGYDALGRVVRPGFAYTGVGNTLAGDGTATYTRDPAGDLVGVAAGGTKTLAWTDQHTDLVAEFTGTGAALTGSRAYDPLGKVLATSGMVGNLGYQSEWTEPASGRVNMWSRWYNTDTGQFDTRDTAEVNPLPASVVANRFAYGDDNPLTTTDPTGHWGWNPLKAVKNVVNTVSNAVSSAYNYVSNAVSTAYNYVSSYVSAAYNYVSNAVSTAYNAVKKTVSKAYNAVKRTVSSAYNKAKNYVKAKADAGRKWVAQKYNQAKKAVQKTYQKAKQVGKVVVAKVTRVANAVVHTVADAYKATEKWVKEHKDVLIEVAAIGAGIAAGLACTALTAGAGALACMVGAAALVNLAKDAAQGNIHNWGDAFGSLGTGALQGLVGGVGGIVGGKIAGALVGKLGSFAASVGGRMLGGALSGGIGDAVSQVATTGRVNLGSVALSAGIGAVFGARGPKGGAPRSGGNRAGAEPEPTPAGRGRGGDRDGPRACSVRHSFDPNTRVLMADGTTRPIKDVNVGDKVLATDPHTGRTEAKPVTALHINRDADLISVAVTRVGGGARAPTARSVLRTTEHHPFWDNSAKRWVNAVELRPGRSTLVAPDGRIQRVSAVRDVAAVRVMRDLTVADIHTYYVVSGAVPVLVHNIDDPCDPAGTNGFPTHDPHDDLGSRARSARDALGESRGREHATYTAAHDPATGRVEAGGSTSAGCAERTCEAALGGGPSLPRFTKAFGWRGGEWREIPVCVSCQSRYSQDQFPPDVLFDPGGAW